MVVGMGQACRSCLANKRIIRSEGMVDHPVVATGLPDLSYRTHFAVDCSERYELPEKFGKRRPLASQYPMAYPVKPVHMAWPGIELKPRSVAVKK